MNFLLITLSLLLHNTLLVQDTMAPLKSKVYKVDINGSPKYSGYLQAIGDNAFFISFKTILYGDTAGGKLVPYHIINRVSMIRKRRVGGGIVIGILAGVIVGTVASYGHTSIGGAGPPIVGVAYLGAHSVHLLVV